MKKFCVVLIILALCISLTGAALAWTVDDVDWSEVDVTIQEPADTPSGWAKAEVDKAVAAGLVPALTGNPKYTDAITREQFAELVVCMVEKVQGGGLEAAGTAFDDSANPAVLKAYAAGIVSGVRENRFSPAAKTNREQIATMLARAVSYLEFQRGKNITPAAADLGKFTDRGQVSSWAVDSVGLLAANGIMQGTGAVTLSPKASCTVEQSILLVYRIYTQFK